MKQSIVWAVLLILVPCFAHAGGEGLYVGAHADFQSYEIYGLALMAGKAI